MPLLFLDDLPFFEQIGIAKGLACCLSFAFAKFGEGLHITSTVTLVGTHIYTGRFQPFHHGGNAYLLALQLVAVPAGPVAGHAYAFAQGHTLATLYQQLLKLNLNLCRAHAM